MSDTEKTFEEQSKAFLRRLDAARRHDRGMVLSSAEVDMLATFFSTAIATETLD